MLTSPSRTAPPASLRIVMLVAALAPCVLAAWSWAVVIGGRAVPWQADRTWLLAFTLAALLHGAWSWGFAREASTLRDGSGALLGILLGWTPVLAGYLAILLPVYLSDTANAMTEQTGWRPLIGWALLLLTFATASARKAALSLQAVGVGSVWNQVVRAFAADFERAAVASLLAVGVLQASAMVMPIGDDVLHYTEVADAIIARQPYPIHIVNAQLQSAGMASAYPALPFFPLLVAFSFSVLGHTLLASALPTTVAVAIFPLALYAAFRSIVGSRAVSYAAGLLVFLFPIYRIHTLGSPEPDTVFVVLLLLAAAAGGKAVRGHGRLWWIVFGIVTGLATLTRPEGVPYAAILFAVFFLARWRDPRYWAAVASFGMTLLPFVVVYYSVAGSPWPRTFGGSMLSWNNFERNLALVQWRSVPWYAQGIGVPVELFLALLLAASLGTIAGTALLWRRRGVIAAVPFAGMANVAAAFFVSPTVLGAYSPTDTIRHLSYGIPFAVIGLVFLLAVAVNSLRRSRFTAWTVAICVLLSAGVLFFEVDGLAHPEPFLGGRTSLLWTADAVTLADLAAVPLEFPRANDGRGWEDVRVELGRPFEGSSLRSVNRSQFYHWATLFVALVGLAYGAALPLEGRRDRQIVRSPVLEARL